MTPQLYRRNGNTIYTVKEGTKQKFYSVNQAKRASRAVQIKHDGALGRGCLGVVK